MKILLVAHSYPRHATDMAGAFLLALARGQQELGHEVAVVAPHAAGLALDERLEGVRVIRYRYGPDAAETLAYGGNMHEQVLRSWPARWRMLHFLYAARRAARRAAREWRPDVVHVHWWFPGGLAAWPRRRTDPPLVLTSHGTDLFLLDRFAPMRALAAKIFRAAAQVTVISSTLARRTDLLGVDRARVTVVPMPIDARVFGSGEGNDRARDPRHLLFVGRLVERKGPEFAVRALAAARAAGHEARLTVVGDGPERDALGRLAAELGVAAHVTFTGTLSADGVERLYREAGVFVFPAVTDWKGEQEGFGLVIVEAMLAGLPVVASASGGIPDIVRDGENGFLVPEREVPALAAAIGRLLADPSLRDRMGAAAREDVRQRFAPERIAAVFDAVYRRAVEDGAASPAAAGSSPGAPRAGAGRDAA